MTSLSDTWNQAQVNDWLKENNFLAFIDKIKSGKVLRQLAKEPSYIEKLATFRSDEEKYTVVTRFKTELLRLLTPKSTKTFVTPQKQPKHSITAPPSRVNSPLTAFRPSPPLSPQPNHVVGKKKIEWSLWAKIEYQSPVKISNVNPNEEIQHLKFRVKNVPELGLQTFLLNDFSLKNQHGKILEPTKKIFEEVQPDEIVYVVLSTPESVIGDFAQFQDIEEPIVVDLKNPELQVFDALPEGLSKPNITKSADEPLYIVAIGTSAGGLESLQKFFDHMEADTGIAFVVVQHLSPTHKSMMVEILSKHTAMTVAVAEHECKVLPDHVYVIPPSVDIFIIEGKIYHRAQDRSLGFSYPINTLFVSLALYKKERAVGIIFSGTGTDGQDGVRDIKENGGMVMAQDSSAQFDGMPRSAVNTGLVDFVMPPEEMGNQLKNYISHMDLVNLRAKQNTEETNEDLRHIFQLVHREFGVDFSKYRLSYLLRRIEHRIVLKGSESLHEYRKLLTLDAQEQSLLFVDLMVRVTRFFRDTEVWEAFQQKVIPKLFDELPSGEPLRIWVVGCSTGEEAYTIGILLLEYLDKNEKSVPIKIYATDIDKAALEFASNGVYDENIVASVSSDRIARFFVKKGPNYHVVRRLRELVLFAPHNISSDPPFHKLSMVSCRNVLLYFKAILQLKVLSFFHYSLKEEGCLIVGASETINERLTTVFNPMKFERGTKRALTVHIFETRKLNRKVTLSTPDEEFSAKQLIRKTVVPTKSKLLRQFRMMEAVHRVWEAEFVPPSVVVDTSGDIIHQSGDLSLLLNFNETNIMKMARSHALSTALAIAMDKANKGDDGENVLVPGVVVSGKQTHSTNGDGDDLETKKEKTVINLKVCPIFQNDDRTYVIFFEPVKTEQKNISLFSPRHTSSRAPSNARLTYQQDNSIYLSRIDDLQQDIDVTQDKLHETQRELEVSHEELQSTNEELLASNEELQSTNEELQSVNEELYALNSEFCAKIEELTELHNDLNNLLSSTSVGTIFLDSELHIRKFTTAVTKHIPVLESDLGRPIGHLANTTYVDLEKDAKKVLETQELVEREIFNASSWYLMRILPYAASDGNLTSGKHSKGVVIIFCEITNQKKIEEQLRKAKEDAESALIAKSDFLSTMSHEIRTPMNVICGFTELLLQQNELASDHREYLQYINTSASMMLSLLDDVLDMTQLESGKFHIQAKSFNLPVVIYRVAQFLSLIAVQRNVDFAVYTTPRIPCELIGDALRIQQVLVNLLSNVLNFSKEGGFVKLSLSVSDPPPAINGTKMKVKFSLEVENTGTMKTWSKKPLNMGLRISRDMINKMNSTLEYSQMSENVFGFHFTVEFPVTGNIPKEGEAVLGGSRDMKDVHVVYYEREGVHAQAVSQMITEMGAKVTRITSESNLPTSYDIIPTHCIISLDHLGSLNKIMGLLSRVLPTSVSYCIASGVNQLMDFKTDFAAVLLSKPIRLDKLARFFVGEMSPTAGRLVPPANAYSGLKVLLTEDNPMNQKIAVRMLKNLNCDVMVAANGIQAIDYVIKNPDIHVIFMDLHMPEMDGLSATKRIKEVRESRGLPPIPVVALTAKVSSEGKETCLKAGMVDFISKPLSREKLGETLSRLFPANYSKNM